MNRIYLPLILFLFFCPFSRSADLLADPGNDLYKLPVGVETRWASPENWLGEKGKGGQARDGRKGSAHFSLAPGEQKILANVQGQSGTVRRIWITMHDRSPEMLRGIRIEIFWDGADRPAVAAPIGDFFCHGLGQMARFDNALFSSPEARSFNVMIPMPFQKGMKIVVTNETQKNQPEFFYDVNYTLGDKHEPGTPYLHAHWRRENPTTQKKDFEILPKVKGRGRYLGAIISVTLDPKNESNWWGEGEVKAYIDGDTTFPTLVGTGTEDYVGSAYKISEFASRYFGCTIAERDPGRYALYRLHVPDPVYFQKDCRVTIQQLGLNLVERADDWSACAWFYLDSPTNDLPPLDLVDRRTANLKKFPLYQTQGTGGL